MYHGGIDPIINPIIGYIPTEDDIKRFNQQMQHLEDTINEYWPRDPNWDDLYENETDEDNNTEPVKITFQNLIRLTNKTLTEQMPKPEDDFSIVMERVQN